MCIASVSAKQRYSNSSHRHFNERFNIGFRLAEGMGLHFTFMWIFAINGLLYVLYLALSGEWKYLLPKRDTLRAALQVVLHDLKIRKAPLPREKFNGAQRIAYTSVVFMGLGSLLTGLAIYKPIQLSWLTALFGGYMIARWIHFWLTMGFCAFFSARCSSHVRRLEQFSRDDYRLRVSDCRR